MHVTLGLICVASPRKAWPMTCIAVRCPPCPSDHIVKRNTQKFERKHLPLRTRIKRLARKTICFAKTTQMPDLVIGLFVNRYAFGPAV
jgi:insertion element IS1 protein InsB